MLIFIFITLAFLIILTVIGLVILFKNSQLKDKLLKLDAHSEHQHGAFDKIVNHLNDIQIKQLTALTELKDSIKKELVEYRSEFDKHLLNSLKILQESLQTGMADTRKQVTETLNANTDAITKRVEKLTKDTDNKLKEISGQVEKRLTEGFEKTTATFSDVIKRLALIDEAQKKITELSSNVVSLQEILSDKKSRGAFGEVQLSGLIRNLMPESSFSFQHTLSSGKRPDCMLFLPEPTGNVAIDAKFPLESFQVMTNNQRPDADRKAAESQFRIDIKRHIQAISEKYIIAGETSDGAVMFIPAEAIFAEIHAHYPDLVEKAQKARVWMVSPTTMMAILTTARAVLKDEATRKEVHVIQEHLGYLAKDFDRFQKRMDNLARHINQANEDVRDATTSARKITTRFSKIEKVELGVLEDTAG